MLEDGDFVVINGKIVTDIDLTSVIRAHREEGAIATLVLKENAAREHFSIVETDSRGRITRFAGFPEPIATEACTAEAAAQNTSAPAARNDAAPLMFTGIQVLSPRIFDYVPRSCFSHSTIHVYPRAIEAGEAVMGYVSDGDWYEMSTLSRYLEASLFFMRKRKLAVLSGADCRIEEGASVEASVLWDRVTVESGTRVREAVLGDGVRLPAGAVVERAVVVRRDTVREIEKGEVIGDNVLVPLL
jgi:NDP-sugar pyrophosphorylase family protein